MEKSIDDHVSMIEEETKRRIDIYYDYMPGSEECKVKPFTLKNFWHTIYLSVFLIGLYVWGAVSIFPSYFSK